MTNKTDTPPGYPPRVDRKMADDEAQRIARLEQRALEAEESIRLMKNFIELLSHGAEQGTGADKVPKADSCTSIEETQSLLAENARLNEEVADLKRSLIRLETLRGIAQVPLPDAVGDTGPTPAPPQPAPQIQHQDKNEKDAKPAEKKSKTKDKAPKKEKPPSAEEEVNVSRLDLRIGKIVGVKYHPNADTLYIEQIDVGEGEPRTILSGLSQDVPIEEMMDRMVIVMCNLKPVKMRGVFSNGMVMCACGDTIELLLPPGGSVPGDRVTFDEYSGPPDAEISTKKKVWEQIQPDLYTDENKVATYKGTPFKVEGKGVCVAPTLAKTTIR